MTLNQPQNRITAAIDAAADELISISHQIHAKPELGYEEFFASKLLADTIEAHGFQVERGLAGVDKACEQVNIEARRMLENGDESHLSSSRFVRRRHCSGCQPVAMLSNPSKWAIINT